VDREEYRQRLAARPHNVRFAELERLLELYGWQLVTVRGSHHVYTLNGAAQISIPFRTPAILAVYVRKAMQLIREYGDDR
jgi:predicted RNA binding protein YcfA (HicA-like mRNA interferase family)